MRTNRGLLSNARPPGVRPIMDILWIMLCVVLSVAKACPNKCVCPSASSKVTCEGADFTDIPRDLPPSVSTLDLTDNHIDTLSSTALMSLRSVVNFKLKNNDIIQIHDGAFQPMESLQTLDLSGNDLTELNQYSLQGPPSLMHLDLSGNQLLNVEGAFARMSELSRLDLSNNNIEKITEFTFRDLTSVRYLLLAGNQISQTDRKAFRNLDKLMYLVLKGNPIGTISRYQFTSQALSYVDMSECGLTRIPRGLPNSVRYLQLRRNNITEVHRHAFQDFPYVSILVLDDSGIQSIQDRTFEQTNYLQQLWLNNNRLSAVPKPLPASLQRLYMDSNLLNNLTNVFPHGSQLNALSFMGNNISYLAHDALSRLSMAKALDLSNNQLEHLYGNTFFNNTQLTKLQLSKNPLKYFHSRAFHGLYNLRTLSLAYIHTQVSMFWDIFDDLDKVTQVDLDSSPYMIQAILSSEELLAGLSSVQDLSMQSSDLTTLRSDFPDKFPNLVTLHISSARWHCDVNLLWFREWLRTTTVQIEFKDSLLCFTPRTLHELPIIDLEPSDFVAATPPSATMYPTERLTTFTTDASPPTTRRTPVISEDDGDDIYDQESESDTFDMENIYSDLENRDDFLFLPETDSKTSQASTNLPPTPGNIPWQEILSRTSLEGSTFAPSDEGRYSIQNDNLSLQTKHSDELQPLATPSSDSEGGKSSGTMMLIIIATSLVTLVIASILIATIIYFSRKGNKRGSCTSARSHSASPTKSKRGGSKNGGGMYQNGIKYKHRGDVLYFMPGSGEESTTDSLQSNASAKKEANMSLVPGRDINHEGPLRCYKWEDF